MPIPPPTSSSEIVTTSTVASTTTLTGFTTSITVTPIDLTTSTTAAMTNQIEITPTSSSGGIATGNSYLHFKLLLHTVQTFLIVVIISIVTKYYHYMYVLRFRWLFQYWHCNRCYNWMLHTAGIIDYTVYCNSDNEKK